MTTRKKLIEVALPLEAINKASSREKSIRHGHPSTLHLWFARRPLAACRAVIFASLVDDPGHVDEHGSVATNPDAPAAFVEACRKLTPGEATAIRDTPRNRLFDFIKTLVQWESTTDETVLEQARHLIRLCTGGNPPPLLDPFAGGGSIPLEAQRLGLEAHASDLNPVPVLINKALIEIPPRFANCPPVNPVDRDRTAKMQVTWSGAQGLAADVRYYGQWMRDRAWERIGHLYPTHNGETVIAWIWARTVKSPSPAVDVHVPLVRSFELSKKPGRKAWVEPQIDPVTKQVSYVVRTGNGAPAIKGTIDRKGAKCIVTGVPITFDYIQAEAKAGRMGVHLIAIVTEGNNARNYHSPNRYHVDVSEQAIPAWKPEYAMSTHPQYMAPPRYGMNTFADLFTPRQLVALTTLSDLVSEARQIISKDAGRKDTSGSINAEEYAQAISIYLSFAVDRLSTRCNSLATWQNVGDKVAHVFARQALPIVWDFAEVNPLSSSTGSFTDAPNWVAEALESIKFDFSISYEKNSALQQDATKLESVSSLVSTDPPYYDNVPYADLSDFFYIWLRRSLRSVYPDLFSTLLTPKEQELVADHQRYGGRDAANKHFENGLKMAFSNLISIANPHYPISVYYAFKQAENEDDDDDSLEQVISSTGWETMLEGLISAGFVIEGTWPMRTERTARTRGIGSNALASSIVLVCRPRPDNAATVSRRQFIEALRRDLPPALRELQSGNIAPVDLAQASIGPGMAVYSRYSKVLEANGAPMSVRTALQIINQELDAYLTEQEGELEADSRFAVAWFEQYGFEAGEFGVADTLARAKNTSVAGVAEAGIVESGKGKVRLLKYDELEPGWEPAADERLTAWEATNHLIQHFNTRTEQGAAELLAKLDGDTAEAARALAYRLYSLCERKGWTDYALQYNALIISWPQISQIANDLRAQRAAPSQMGLGLGE